MLSKTERQLIQKKIQQKDGQYPIIFAALGDISRFRIILFLLEQPEVCVTDVANLLEISVSAASQQLKILELAQLLQKERMGQMICYRLKKDNPLTAPILKLL